MYFRNAYSQPAPPNSTGRGSVKIGGPSENQRFDFFLVSLPSSAQNTITTLAGGGNIAGDGSGAVVAALDTYPLSSPSLNDFAMGLISGQIASDSSTIFIADAGSLLVRRIDQRQPHPQRAMIKF